MCINANLFAKRKDRVRYAFFVERCRRVVLILLKVEIFGNNFCKTKNCRSNMGFLDFSTDLSTNQPQNVDNFVENSEFLYFSA